MAKTGSGVRSPFTGVSETTPLKGSIEDQTEFCGEGFPEEVTYVGDCKDLPYDGTNFVEIPVNLNTQAGIKTPFQTIPMTKKKG